MPAKKPRIVKLRPAVLDVTEIADYLSDATSLAAARRFVLSVEKTVELLARSPGLGTLWGDEAPELLNARYFETPR